MNPARGLVLVVCFGVIVWSSRAMAETGASLSALPLKDRCAVALLVAKEVREVVEISPQGAGVPEDPRKLQILISRTADGENPISIFRKRESCGEVSLPLTWTKGGKIDVEFAAGDPRKLDPVAYMVVSVRSRASPGWEFIWPLNRAYVGCERDADPRVPKICLGLALPSTWPWVPALRVKIKRLGNDPAARHEFLVDEAVLEIVRAWSGGTNAKDTTGNASTSLAQLPLADRCTVAMMIAKEVRETAEVIRRASDVIETGRLRLLISQSPEGNPPVSIFAAGEGCEKHRMPLSWTLGKYVDLDLAAGDVRSLPADPYVLLSTKPATASSWEVTWRVDERYRSCPAARGTAPCNEAAPRTPGREMPTLRLKVGWHGRGKERELGVLDAVIEIAKFS